MFCRAGIGLRKVAQVQDALDALEVRLLAEEMTKLEGAVFAGEIAGSLYGPHRMAMLDSEK